MGVAFLIATIAGNFAPYIAGVVYDRQGGYAMAFYGMAVIVLIGAVCVPFAKPPKPVLETV
jgi:hypothetical protein